MITGKATTAGSTSVFQWGDKQDSSLGGGGLCRRVLYRGSPACEGCHGHAQSFFKVEAVGLQPF